MFFGCTETSMFCSQSWVFFFHTPKLGHWIPIQKHVSSDRLTLVICCTNWIILASFVTGNLTSHYKDSCEPASMMECQPTWICLRWFFLFTMVNHHETTIGEKSAWNWTLLIWHHHLFFFDLANVVLFSLVFCCKIRPRNMCPWSVSRSVKQMWKRTGEPGSFQVKRVLRSTDCFLQAYLPRTKVHEWKKTWVEFRKILQIH